MKKLLLSVAIATLAIHLHGQGVVSMNTLVSGGPRATNEITGLPAQQGQASGTFLAQLYYAGGAGQPVGALQSVTNAPATFGTTAANAGYISSSTGGGNRILDVVGPITVQIRAWHSSGGATYEAAVAANALNPGSVLLGASALINSSANVAPTAPGSIVGPGYLITGIPEPSSIALGLLGLGAIALFRRRK